MNFLPTDWGSFVWGAAVGAVGAFGVGVLTKAGDEFYTWLKSKIQPEPPSPMQVPRTFIPTGYERSQCAWARQENVFDRLQQGYAHYKHPPNATHCYRVTDNAGERITEYLLVK